MNIFNEGSLDADGFPQPFAVHIAIVNPLAALPQHAAKLPEALEQHGEVASLHVFAGA